MFDLVNIIPWLKSVMFYSNMCLVLNRHGRQHDNTNPITKEPLKPADLITLHYSRKTTGEIHDPISFKPFSEHSHIVAIATTGNTFLAESIKGGRDLVDDVKFKKYATHSRLICHSYCTCFQRRCDHIAKSARNAFELDSFFYCSSCNTN